MAYHRGEVVAVPYDYSNLMAGKVWPAVIVSSDAYNRNRPDVVVAGISSQVAKAGGYDHVLADWPAAGLRYPSLVRGRLLTVEESLIRSTVGRLSRRDLAAVEAKLASFLLSDRAVADYLLSQVDLNAMPGEVLQSLTEKLVEAAVRRAGRQESAINIARLRAILPK